MVTIKKSDIFSYLEGVCVALLIFLGLLFLLKKISLISLVLLLVSLLILLSFIWPWWHLEGEGNGSVTTNVFLIPQKMVTVGQLQDTINGEIATLPSLFTLMLSIVVFSLSLSLLFLILSLIVPKKLFLFSILLLLGAIIIFSYGMHVFSSITTGSMYGSEEMYVSLPGSSEELMKCTWHPGGGFYVICISAVFLLVVFLLTVSDKIPAFFRKKHFRQRNI
jgi:hypothetical protein